MAWIRLVLAMAMVSLVALACSSPTAPRYPQEKEDEENPPPGEEKTGFHQEIPAGVTWV